MSKELKPEPFDADGITPHNWENVLAVRKRPLVVHALQLNFPEGFKVTTLEGVMCGRPGDFLMFGVDGEKYPCKKEIFKKTYELVEATKAMERNTRQDPIDL